MVLAILVAVGPAGTRVDPAAWEADRAAADATAQARDFPDVGARARAQAPFFSPDGATSGVAFTTSDALFDVPVSVFEASSDFPHGDITALDAARRISRAYDATLR